MQLPPIPTDRPVFESAIATYWMEEGILISLSKNIKRTVALIQENMTVVQGITGGRPVPLLIYLTSSPMPDKETRQFSTEALPVIYSAMAMISKPGLASFIMRLLFRFQKPPIPMKVFDDPAEARAWLKQ
jgi:hypothetical protein